MSDTFKLPPPPPLEPPPPPLDDPAAYVSVAGKPHTYIHPTGHIMVCQAGQTPADLLAVMKAEEAERKANPPPPPPAARDVLAELDELRAQNAALMARLAAVEKA